MYFNNFYKFVLKNRAFSGLTGAYGGLKPHDCPLIQGKSNFLSSLMSLHAAHHFS